MKIYEIIATEGTWDDFVGGLAKGAGHIFGRGSTWRSAQELAPDVVREMTRLGKKSLTDEEVEKILARKWTSTEYEEELEAYASELHKPVSYLTPSEIQSVKVKYYRPPDPKLVKETNKAAKDLYSKEERTKATDAIKGVGEVAGKAWTVTKFLTNLGFTANFIKEASAPIKTYLDNMQEADGWVAAGQIPPEYQETMKDHTLEEWYNWYRARELNVMLGKLAVIWGGLSLVGLNPVSRLFKVMGMAKSATLLGTVGNAAVSTIGAFLAKWANEGMDAMKFSQLFVLSIPALGINLPGVVGGNLASFLDNQFGSAFEKAKNSGAISTTGTGSDKGIAGQKDPNAKGKADAGADKDATSQNDNKGAQTPADNKEVDTDFPDGAPGTPGSPWVSLGNGRWKNKNNGELVLY